MASRLDVATAGVAKTKDVRVRRVVCWLNDSSTGRDVRMCARVDILFKINNLIARLRSPRLHQTALRGISFEAHDFHG